MDQYVYCARTKCQQENGQKAEYQNLKFYILNVTFINVNFYKNAFIYELLNKGFIITEGGTFSLLVKPAFSAFSSPILYILTNF